MTSGRSMDCEKLQAERTSCRECLMVVGDDESCHDTCAILLVFWAAASRHDTQHGDGVVSCKAIWRYSSRLSRAPRDTPYVFWAIAQRPSHHKPIRIREISLKRTLRLCLRLRQIPALSLS